MQGREHILTMYDVFQFQKEDTTNIVVRMELLTSLEEYTKNRSVDSNFVVKMGIDLSEAVLILPFLTLYRSIDFNGAKVSR